MPTPRVTRQIMRELTQLRQDPPEGIRICTNEENMLDLTGIIEGPAGTPYEGGYFRIKFNFTEDFPTAPPKCHFITKLFHPNVSSSGEICVNTLKKDWQSSFGIAHILVTIKCLLIYPNPESALDEEAGKLLLEDYAAFEKRAKLITEVHAQPKVRPVEFNTPPSRSPSSTAPGVPTPAPITTTMPLPVSVRTSTSPSPPSSKASVPNALSKSTSPSPAIPITPFQPSVNASSLVNTIIPPTPASTVLQPSSQAGNRLPGVGVPPTGKTPGKRVSSVVAGGVEKKKKALKRL
ncbi:ubiquitin-conjugating enzyme/RWD-like protein [Hysterangium stoloniferum]|nr:ubiquitin-conjugating enzyme/RWD-like protein [Hysterangium stoloniferum]